MRDVRNNTSDSVRRAFSQKTLKRVCEMHESEFAEAYDMKVNVIDYVPGEENFYLFKDNGADVLAVAHLDTVMPHDRRTANFISTASGPVVYSGALDDRLGAYTILELLPKLGIQYDILLTVGEESGQSTAQYFDPIKEYNWVIEFDRGGTDVVLYQYEDNESMQLVRRSGAKVGDGIFSDISYMDHLEVKCFNWGVGYRDYHGPRSHAYLEDYWEMVSYFLEFHEENADVYLPHEAKDNNYGSFWGSPRRTYTDEWWDDEPTEAEVTVILDEDEVISDDFNVVNERLIG